MAKATIKTIAEEAGVSTATVSKALNDMPDVSQLVKERIREIARKQGYIMNTAAKQLAKGYSNEVGVILPDIAQRDTAVVYKTIANRLQLAGFSVYLGNSGDKVDTEAQIIYDMLEKRIGVIIIMPTTSEMRHIEEIVQGQIPVIYIGGAVNPHAQNAVTCDDYKGGMIAAQALYTNGCRSCAVFTWGAASTAQHERTRGFIAYMQERGGFVKTYNVSATLQEAAGREMANTVLADKLPDGIFATDDLLALGAMDALKQARVQVPRDVQLVGYGNSPSGELGLVQLTSIANPSNEIGICASDLALGLWKDRQEVVRKITLEPRLVLRRSTRRPVR